MSVRPDAEPADDTPGPYEIPPTLPCGHRISEAVGTGKCAKCAPVSVSADDTPTIRDANGHAWGCPAYNQPTFTICECGAVSADDTAEEATGK